MSKKKQQLATVMFLAAQGSKYIESAVYKQIALKTGGLRFLHIERKGNTWVILEALEFVDESKIAFTINYHREGVVGNSSTHLLIGDARVGVTVYTIINIPGESFYHLDELPDGSWRVTHSDNMIDFSHTGLTDLAIRAI